MKSKVTIKRIDTGVPGLDEVLGGGLPEYSFNLIAGPPGCGKTTLAHQMMFAMATPERPAVYFTVLGEPPLKMLRYQQQFDFFDSARVADAIHFINLADAAQEADLALVLRRISEAVSTINPSFVFVDSFRSVVMSTVGEGAPPAVLQRFVQELGVLMSSWEATTFLIGEYATEMDANPVFTVADGLIWLRQSVERNSMVRKLEVMKMRGQPSLPGLHSFRIGTAGLTVFAPANIAVGPDATRLHVETMPRAHTGILALDEMLGGGLPRGYSLLVAGPSGSGKSILASAFLAEGVRIGERGVIVSFEQRPSPARNPIIAELVRREMVGVVDTRAPDLSIDEIVSLIAAEITRLDARRLVIDSLSGFELALAPTFREEFRASLARMVMSLARTGVTMLMTSELEDRYTDLRFSPYGTAFLTDAIVVMRYIEVDSRLRRMLAVVKVRASDHSNELREFTIDDAGIQVGAMLSNHEGLLGGRPTYHAGSAGSPTTARATHA